MKSIIIQRPEHRSIAARAGSAPPVGLSILCAIAVCVFPLSYASSTYGADATRGRALYENHCQYCHTPRIHSRPNRLPMSRHEVRLLTDDWRRQANLAWTPDEVEDVVEYLNVTRYRFAPD